MGYVLRPPMPVGTLWPNNIILLPLFLGADFEFVTCIVLFLFNKPTSIGQHEIALKILDK
jgi:hypothetical protein